MDSDSSTVLYEIQRVRKNLRNTRSYSSHLRFDCRFVESIHDIGVHCQKGRFHKWKEIDDVLGRDYMFRGLGKCDMCNTMDENALIHHPSLITRDKLFTARMNLRRTERLKYTPDNSMVIDIGKTCIEGCVHFWEDRLQRAVKNGDLKEDDVLFGKNGCEVCKK